MAIPLSGRRPAKQISKTDLTDLPVGKVFVVGGVPTHTYVDRGQSGMGQAFADAMEDGGKLIAISGPTKSGKTVFCKRMLAETPHVWLGGGSVSSADDVWRGVIHILDGATVRQVDTVSADEQSVEGAVEGGVSAFGLNLRGVKGKRRTQTTTTVRSKARETVSFHEATALLLEAGATLVVDDFHYVDEQERVRLVRALKSAIENGLRVVFLCVPHRAIEPIRAERDMQGRIALINVPDWRDDELKEIANRGFAALNVAADDKILDEFVLESFGSPHLMQEFCKHLCRLNDVRTKQILAKALPLRDRNGFFRRSIEGGAEDVLVSLAAGPSTRARRQRNFVTGETGDTYVAVLRAIANTGPKTRLTYNELRESLRDILSEEPPPAHEITRVLEKISQISKQRFGDRGAIDFEDSRKTIHIVDPFVAFYMRWGPPIGAED